MKIALLGNPNTGKSSVFNMLTGLRQRIGNFPGVTVDKKTGKIEVDGETHEIVDFPGTYSIYPRSKDEEVVYNALSSKENGDYPEAAIVVIDASNLERNLLLFSQIYDLQFPTMMVLNMSDLARKNNANYDIENLRRTFPEALIVEANARVKIGKQKIIDGISKLQKRAGDQFIDNSELASIKNVDRQIAETKQRIEKIRSSFEEKKSEPKKTIEEANKLDRILVHPIYGFLIFALILLVVFQFIFAFATIPMDFIDGSFGSLSMYLQEQMPAGVFTDLLTQGIIPGIGGVVIFIPQIALLFFFIAILEETGYLSRVVFIMDRLMRPLGLNGKSIVPLLSSVACAIPGVMSARTISDWKERMITIMVAPLMSCSARIPVYTILIAVVVPNETVLGFVNVQGLVLFGLYALGTIMALVVALVL
jgi:ferrous iron transport protein B